MRRLAVALVCLAASAGLAAAQSGMRDRYFVRYPFDKWKAEGPVAQLRWSPKISAPHLSVHQRLAARVDFQLDTKETVRRRSRGEIVAFIEITDAAGRLWRTHDSFDLSRIPAAAKAQPILFSQSVFLVPGEYRVALAICDSKTLDHSFATRALRVEPLHNDPLPDAWRDLPAVEFPRNFALPESWFQPSLRGRLYLPLETRRPVHVDVVMNISASDRVAASVGVFRRNMSVLVPALKVLAGIAPKDGTLDVTVLDLARQTGWEQKGGRGLDWRKMREPFALANPGVIDVESLGAKAEMLRFFRDQVAGKAEARPGGEALRVVIVLSAPLFLEKQYKAAAPLPKDPNRRIYYVRCRPLRVPPEGVAGGEVLAPSIASDDLAGVIRGLDGRILDVITPGQLRKALAGILEEVARIW